MQEVSPTVGAQAAPVVPQLALQTSILRPDAVEQGRIAGGFVTYGTNRYHSLMLGCLGESQLCS